MRTLTNIAIITLTFASSVFANSNEKFYEVTDKGKFQYSYWMEEGSDNAKADVKPVTIRTFYLEATRNGLLPVGMTYSAFVKLSVEEIQSIMFDSQYDIISALKDTETIIRETELVAEDIAEPVTETAETAERIALDIDAPWVVQAITNPGTESELPTDQVTLTVEDRELPWVVDAVVNHGEYNASQKLAQTLATTKTMRASK